MIDILNSNKEYSIKVRFVQGGARAESFVASLLGCIETGDILSVDPNAPEVQSYLLTANSKESSDTSVVELVMGVTRGEAASINTQIVPDSVDEEGEVEEYE